MGNAALEYKLLGVTDDKGKVSGSLAAAKLFFVQGEPFHLIVEYTIDSTTTTECIALNSTSKELLVANGKKIDYSVTLDGKDVAQVLVNLYSYDTTNKALQSLNLGKYTFTSTPKLAAPQKLDSGFLVTLNKSTSYTIEMKVNDSASTTYYYNGKYE